MKLLKLTSDSPAENLAIDEALLESAETNELSSEVLRLWEPQTPMVVIGRSSPFEKEVNLGYCRQHSIPVFRRCSGGQSIVTGPGCLMYAVLLDYRLRPELRMLEVAHRFVMEQMQEALKTININTEMQGTSDLTLAGKKFSGNALRCKRHWFVYHGTMLCDFDVDLIADCLGEPIRQPGYRQQRSHRDFLTQLPTTTKSLGAAIVKQWDADEVLESWPHELTAQLVQEKYKSREWSYRV